MPYIRRFATLLPASPWSAASASCICLLHLPAPSASMMLRNCITKPLLSLNCLLVLLLESWWFASVHRPPFSLSFVAACMATACDYIVEYQRGLKFFGIPLYSQRSLIPFADPSEFETLGGRKLLLSYGSIQNYPLPDLDWNWDWERWYVLMTDSVDDQGWMYAGWSGWSSKYRLGTGIRRRIWVRRRRRGSSADSTSTASLLADAGQTNK